ncbi:hypothetical protein BC833DRAFT_396727 [Globomyces pollinis-pini]|nr:hypothetical protein BC833DRAFT_396727 [Globomyces pollinis-pini]KAJ2992645.1 hypothetical protein HDV02_002955 [Globomyces sp. JEL0801]
MKISFITLIQLSFALVVNNIEKRDSHLNIESVSKREDSYEKKVCCRYPLVRVGRKCVDPGLITFDEEIFDSEFGYGLVYDGYFGLKWPQDFSAGYINKTNEIYQDTPGVQNGVISYPNGFGGGQTSIPAIIGSDGGPVFTLFSGYFTSVVNNPNEAFVVGYLNGVEQASHSFPVTPDGPTFVDLEAQGFINIDKFTIIGDGSDGSFIIVDNLLSNLTN